MFLFTRQRLSRSGLVVAGLMAISVFAAVAKRPAKAAAIAEIDTVHMVTSVPSAAYRSPTLGDPELVVPSVELRTPVVRREYAEGGFAVIRPDGTRVIEIRDVEIDHER